MNTKIYVISSKTCKPCQALKKRLNEMKYPYTEIDRSDVNEIAKIMGEFKRILLGGIPVIIVKNNDIITGIMTGVKEKEIKKFLGDRSQYVH